MCHSKHTFLSFPMKPWSIRSKLITHHWCCFLISATNCCHLMHSPLTGLTQTPRHSWRWEVIGIWDLSVLFWNRNVGDHKRLLWPDDHWSPNAIHKGQGWSPKNDGVVDPGQRWPWGHMLSAQSCVKFWELCFVLFSHITKRYVGLCRTQKTKTLHGKGDIRRIYCAILCDLLSGWLYIFKSTAIWLVLNYPLLLMLCKSNHVWLSFFCGTSKCLHTVTWI